MKTFRLKGHDKLLPNETVLGQLQQPAAWFFYASYSAGASNNTLKIPISLRDKMGGVDGKNGIIGYANKILPPAINHFKDNPEFQCDPVLNVFTKAVSDFRDTLVLCGSFDQLCEADWKGKGVLTAIGMGTQEEYDAVAARVAAKKKTFGENVEKIAPAPAFNAAAKCPFLQSLKT
jgi:hypothetical protein